MHQSGLDIPVMNKKFSIVLILVLIVGLGLALAYAKYNRYLPTPKTASSNQPVQAALTEQQIDHIRHHQPIDHVQVFKAKRIVELLHQNQVIRRYDMRLGFDPIGHKIKEGDGKTPEGRYVLDWRNPNSQFYKSLHISYPNQQDKANAKALGVSAGGDVMIHGSANHQQLKALPQLMDYLPQKDWTWGCVAVRNVDMDEIWKLVNDGTPITLYP